ncbi:hypothetical protein [Streptomyces sp. NPDC048385]|uniref:hypothetical protein n=1 Tax=Streptomyces sp. NPDC048385 TaxID=3155145 RepID=UPI00342030EF
MPESFTSAELAQIRERYRTQDEALQLLDEAQVTLPNTHFKSAKFFWAEVNRQLLLGMAPGGKDRILNAAQQEYPGAQLGSTTSQQIMSGQQTNPGPPTTQAPTQPAQPPSSVPPPETPSSIQLKTAIIGGLVTVAVAAIAIIPNLTSSGDAKQKDSATPTTSITGSASNSQTPLIDPNGGITGTPALIRPQISINPTSGKAGSTDVTVHATGFLPHEDVKIEFDRGTGLTKFEGPYNSENVYRANGNGVVTEEIPVPGEYVGVCCSGGKLSVRITSVSRHSSASDHTLFTLT